MNPAPGSRSTDGPSTARPPSPSPATSSRPLWPALGVAVVLSALLAAFGSELRLPDEPRVAHTSYELWKSREPLLPRVNGQPFLQTPPLVYWIEGAWLNVVDHDGMARVPSLLFSLLTLASIGGVAWRFHGERAAFIAVALLASTSQFWEVGYSVVVEPALTFFCVAALLLLASLMLDGVYRSSYAVLIGLSTALAFFSKGLPGPLCVLLVGGVAWLCSRTPLKAGLQTCVVAALVGVCSVAPWALAFSYQHVGGVQELVLDHLLRRVVEGSDKNPSNWTFFHRTLANLLPWTPLVLFAVPWHLRKARRKAPATAPGQRVRPPFEGRPPERGIAARRWSTFLLVWALLPVVVLLLSRSKRGVYLLPALPAFSLLTATWLDSIAAELRHAGWQRHLRRLAVFLGVALLVGCVLLPTAPFWRDSAGSFPESLSVFHIVSATLALAVAGKLMVGIVAPQFRGAYRTSEDSSSPPDRPPLALDCGDAVVRVALIFVVLGVGVYGTLRHTVREPERSLAAFGRELREREATGQRVVGFRLSEREVGAVAWSLRHAFPAFDDAQRCAEWIAGGEGPASILLLAEVDELTKVVGRFESVGLRAGRTEVQKELRRRILHGVTIARAATAGESEDSRRR